MSAEKECRHCDTAIRLVNFAMGEQWMHVDTNASFPDQHKGTMWRHCKVQVAAPSECFCAVRARRAHDPFGCYCDCFDKDRDGCEHADD